MSRVLRTDSFAASAPRRLAPHRCAAAGGAAALVVSLLAGSAAMAAAAIEIDPAFPREGSAARITVTLPDGAPAAGDTVRAVYRPSSEVSRTETVGIVGGDGRVAWTPIEAGVVTLTATPPAEAPDRAVETRNLSVPFRSTPIPGVIVLVVAGFILYGGVISGFRRLNEAPPALPPDT